MKRSVIIIVPKVTHALLIPENMDALAKFYKCKGWSMFADGVYAPKLGEGILHFTSDRIWAMQFCRYKVATIANLERSVRKYNESIPLTKWSSGLPEIVGEYNATRNRDINIRRWWNGQEWSHPWSVHSQKEYACNKASMLENVLVEKIEWRGLSRKPMTFF